MTSASAAPEEPQAGSRPASESNRLNTSIRLSRAALGVAATVAQEEGVTQAEVLRAALAVGFRDMAAVKRHIRSRKELMSQ